MVPRQAISDTRPRVLEIKVPFPLPLDHSDTDLTLDFAFTLSLFFRLSGHSGDLLTDKRSGLQMYSGS